MRIPPYHPPPPFGTVPLYRLFSTSANDRFYIANPYEGDDALDNKFLDERTA